MTDSLVEIEQQDIEPAQEPTGVPTDDMLSKATVSKIVERERLKAFEKGRNEALMQIQNEQQQAAPQEAPQMIQQASQGLGGMAPQLTQADVERMISERAPQALQDQIHNMRIENTVNAFVSKMQAAEQKYPGIQDKLNKLNYESIAPLIQHANEMENTADIMQELLNHPHKMVNLSSLMREQPYFGQMELMNLSNSIKQNDTAKAQEAQANDPMSRLKPSANIEMTDSGDMSVNDLRKMLSKRK